MKIKFIEDFNLLSYQYFQDTISNHYLTNSRRNGNHDNDNDNDNDNSDNANF